MVLMPYDNKWRNIRKIMHQLLTAKQAETYRPFQDRESKQLLWDYLHAPDDFWRHNGRYANSVIMSVVFGKRTRADDPDVIQLFGTIDDFLGNTTPGKWLVDSFPSLAKLPKPLQWWRPFAEDGYRRTIEYGPLFDRVLILVCTKSSLPNLRNLSLMAPPLNASQQNSMTL
jgi:cytochrome P450